MNSFWFFVFSFFIAGFLASPQSDALATISGGKCKVSSDKEVCEICSKFVNCSDDYLVVGLNYSFGSIPTHIGLLTSLTYLNLNALNLAGTIPTQLALCRSLVTLILSNNNLRGSIPSQLGLCTKLEYIDLNVDTKPGPKNRISGPIPSELSNCRNMQFLSIRGHGIRGTFPTILFESWSNISFISINSNTLTGTIPTEIGKLSRLKHFSFGRGLTGTIPTEIGNWYFFHISFSFYFLFFLYCFFYRFLVRFVLFLVTYIYLTFIILIYSSLSIYI